MINKNKILKAVYEGIKSSFKFAHNDNNSIIDFEDSKINNIESLDIEKLHEKFIKCINSHKWAEAVFLYESYGFTYKVKDSRNDLLYMIQDIEAQLGYNVDLNWIDVSNVTNMSYLFYASFFNGDISKWDVSKVGTMEKMFQKSSFNGDISKWDVSSVMNMGQMFEDSKFNEDISKWNVSNVLWMERMFQGTPFNGDISKWKINACCNKREMFRLCPIEDKNLPAGVKRVNENKLQPGFKFSSNDKLDKSPEIDFNDAKIDNVEPINIKRLNNDFRQFIATDDFDGMFNYIDLYSTEIIHEKYVVESYSDLKTIISNFIAQYGPNVDLNWLDVSYLAILDRLFQNRSDEFGMLNNDSNKWNNLNIFNGDISKWDVSHVTSMSWMFANSNFNEDLSNWDVSNVTNMNFMFYASVFNKDISNWDVSNAKYLNCMFMHSKFNKDISNWNIQKDARAANIFSKCPIKNEYKPIIKKATQKKII